MNSTTKNSKLNSKLKIIGKIILSILCIICSIFVVKQKAYAVDLQVNIDLDPNGRFVAPAPERNGWFYCMYSGNYNPNTVKLKGYAEVFHDHIEFHRPDGTKIEGKDSYFPGCLYTGQIAVMVSMANAGQDPSNHFGNSLKSNRQRWMWNHLGGFDAINWMRGECGINISEFPLHDEDNSGGGTFSTEEYNNFIPYFSGSGAIEAHAELSSVGAHVEMNTVINNSTDYVAIGPLTISNRSGNITGGHIYDKDGVEYANRIYAYRYSEHDYGVADLSGMENNREFYVLINKTEFLTRGGTTRFVLDVNDIAGTAFGNTLMPCRIAFWYGDNGTQPLVSLMAGTYDIKTSDGEPRPFECPVNVPVIASININKYADDGNGNANTAKGMLSGARFTIRLKNGGYLRHGSNWDPNTGTGTITDDCYTNVTELTEEQKKQDNEYKFLTMATQTRGINLGGLKPGEYEVEEVVPPPADVNDGIGYGLSFNGDGSGNKGTFIVSENNIVTPDRLDFINKPLGGLVIKKFAADGFGNALPEKGLLAGAVFTVYSETENHYVSAENVADGSGIVGAYKFNGWTDNEALANFNTGSEEGGIEGKGNEIKITGLPPGTYKVTEVKPPTGYNLSHNGEEGGNVGRATIEENSSELIPLDFHNKKIPEPTNSNLKIYKYQEITSIGQESFGESLGEKTNVLLPGAEFIVWFEPDVSDEYYKELGLTENQVYKKYNHRLIKLDEEGNAQYTNYEVTNYYDNTDVTKSDVRYQSYIPKAKDVEGDGEEITIDDENYPIIKDEKGLGYVELKNILPGSYIMKEIKAPNNPTNGTGQTGKGGESTSTTIERGAEPKRKGDETYNDFQIDESPANGLQGLKVGQNYEHLFMDETAAGIHIRKYEFDNQLDYDNASESQKTAKKASTKVTIQLKPEPNGDPGEGSPDRAIVRDDERNVSDKYIGRYLDPNSDAWIGDYNSAEGAYFEAHRKDDVYKEAADQDAAVAAGYVFEIPEGGEVFLRHLIPGRYIIREVDESKLQRAEIYTKQLNGGEDETIVYADSDKANKDIETAQEDGVEVYTRKKEFYHPVVSLWNGDGSKVEIEKVDEDENPVKGAVITLAYVGDGSNPNAKPEYVQKSGTVKRDDYGPNEVKFTIPEENPEESEDGGDSAKIVFRNLKPGKYQITEVEAPDGYSKLEDPIEFEVKEKMEEPLEIKIEDEEIKTQELQVYKVEKGTEKQIKDARFTLQYTQPDNKYSTYKDLYVQTEKGKGVTLEERYTSEEKEFNTKAEEGGVSFNNLLPGKYTVKETNPPPGYSLTDQTPEQLSATVVENSEETVKITIENEKKRDCKLIIEKRDAETGMTIKDSEATFQIEYNDAEDGNKYVKKPGDYASSQTDIKTEGGFIELDNLKAGSYTIKEVEAPDGYDLANPATVDKTLETGDNVVIIYDNPTPETPSPSPSETPESPGELGMYKYIKGTKKGLEKFEFQITEHDINDEYPSICRDEVSPGTVTRREDTKEIETDFWSWVPDPPPEGEGESEGETPVSSAIKFINSKNSALQSVSEKSQYNWPVVDQTNPNNRAKAITSMVGKSVSPKAIGSSNHKGMDLACNTNSSIVSTNDGTVIRSGWYGRYGYTVIIDHGEKSDGEHLYSLYGHNNSLLVKVGDKVSENQLIALAGSTGDSTETHCYFEIKRGTSFEEGYVIDPISLFTESQVIGATSLPVAPTIPEEEEGYHAEDSLENELPGVTRQQVIDHNEQLTKQNEEAEEWNDKLEEYNKKVDKAQEKYNARQKLIRENTKNGVLETNKQGYIDLTFLGSENLAEEADIYEEYDSTPTEGDDGHGLIEIKEISVGNNPYFNVDPNNKKEIKGRFEKEDSPIIFENKRMRVDIEGYIWEDIPSQGKEGSERRTADSIFGSGRDHLLYPIVVKLKNGNQVLGEGIITTDGYYRIRAGGSNGEFIDYITDKSKASNTYIEFTYNGLKYQSCYDAVLGQANGSKAEEKPEERRAFNEKLGTIVSNSGAPTQSNTGQGNTVMNYNSSGSYEKEINYEGDVSGQFTGEAGDPIADGKYTLGRKMPKASEKDPQTQQKEGNGDTSRYPNNTYYIGSEQAGSKYQIHADTNTAGFRGFIDYDVTEDKITDVNLGVYEREQPDISLVNDIERVIVKINDESYLYQYGKKLADTKSVFDQDPTVKFGSNTNPQKYTREVQAEKIQVDPSSYEGNPFEVKIYYKTAIRNESKNLLMQPVEVLSQYDSKYTAVRDATAEVAAEIGPSNVAAPGEWKNTSSMPTGNRSAPNGYKNAYRTITDVLQPEAEVVFYTEYTVSRDQAKGLIQGQPTLQFFNNVEINAYKTTYPGQERGGEIGTDAFAGVDMDSIAGNANPSNKQATFEDDNDEAPVLELVLGDTAVITGQVFEDLASEEKAGNRDAGDLMAYLGNGKKDNTENGIENITVELIELDDNGNEILEDGKTKVKMTQGNQHTFDTVPASVTTDSNGTYRFEGFVPGEYLVKYTWGQGKQTIIPSTNQKAYVQQYKSTKFDNEERYRNMTSNPERNRWYLDSSNLVDKSSNLPLSNAIDDMTVRKKIDNQIQNTGNDVTYGADSNDPTYQPGKTYIYPSLEDDNVNKNLIKEVSARTPAFDVGVEEVDTDSEDTSQKSEGKNDYPKFEINNLVFGLTKRPKMDMNLSKRIERVKLSMANGNTILDASVEYDKDGNGSLKRKHKKCNISNARKRICFNRYI